MAPPILVVAQVVVVSTDALRLLDRATRKPVKGLAQKLRADQAELHLLAVATGLSDRGDALALHLVSAHAAIALRPEGHNHSGVACARQRPKHSSAVLLAYMAAS